MLYEPKKYRHNIKLLKNQTSENFSLNHFMALISFYTQGGLNRRIYN